MMATVRFLPLEKKLAAVSTEFMFFTPVSGS